MTTGEVITYFAGALIILGTNIYTKYASDKSKKVTDATAAKLETTRVDGQAYDRARVINEEMVASLRAEVERLSKEIESLRAELNKERRHSADLEDHIDRLERSVARLVSLLEAAQIEVPKEKTT